MMLKITDEYYFNKSFLELRKIIDKLWLEDSIFINKNIIEITIPQISDPFLIEYIVFKYPQVFEIIE